MQGWHKHHEIEEVLLVQSGKVKIEELENQQIISRICAEGELIRMHKVFIGLVILIRYLHHLQYFVLFHKGKINKNA